MKSKIFKENKYNIGNKVYFIDDSMNKSELSSYHIISIDYNEEYNTWMYKLKDNIKVSENQLYTDYEKAINKLNEIKNGRKL